MPKSENVYKSRKKMLFDNFLGGVAWSVGVWLGTTLIIAIAAYFVSRIDLIPIIGDYLAEILKHAAQKASNIGF